MELDTRKHYIQVLAAICSRRTLNVPCDMIPYNLSSIDSIGHKNKDSIGIIWLFEQGSFTEKMGVNLTIIGNKCSDALHIAWVLKPEVASLKSKHPNTMLDFND